MTPQEYQNLTNRKAFKYKNVPVKVDGIRFHSRKEAARYQVLKSLQVCGEIRNLQLQVKYYFPINGENLRYPDRKRKGSPVVYFADFVYEELDKKIFKWHLVVEDTKGLRLDVYKLKAALMLACHNIKILET